VDMQSVKSFTLLEKYFLAKGYTFEQLALGHPSVSHFATMKSPQGKYVTFPTSILTYPFPTATTAKITIDKIKTYDFAKLLNVIVPNTYTVSTQDYDLTALQEMLDTHHTLVVKPHNSTQSRGLTTDITELDQLKTAISHAGTVSEIALVQQQVSGEELRFIAVDGAIRSVLLREKPFIVGDGVSTIPSLIVKENEARSTITDTLVNYPQLDERLVPKALLTSDYVPADGEKVELSTKTMIRDGASVYDVFSSVHPDYLDIATRLTERFGRGFVAVDLMIQDYTQAAQPSNYAMIEMKSSISLPLCYSCRDGKHFKVVEDYLGPMIEKAIA
jgi:D-alanine-D-alanine ligase-like ATP-grasp enzyme